MPRKKVSRKIDRRIKQQRAALARYPLLFTLLSTFGLVATLYGFEGIIDEIALLSRYPIILLATGVIVLIFTGSLYKKLS